MEITKQQYENALDRIEELLPLVTDDTPSSDKNAVESAIVSDAVEEYEKLHYPISKPTIVLGITPAAILGLYENYMVSTLKASVDTM